MTGRVASTLLRRATPAVALAVLAGCGDADVPAPTGAQTATVVAMDYTRPGFYAAPWPSESLRRADGGISLAGFPDPTGAPIVGRIRGLIEADSRGFSSTSGVFLPLTGALGSELVVALDSSLDPSAPVFLVPIVAGAVGPHHPIEARFRADGGPFGAANLLSLLPLQGAPLAPHTLYAGVVTRSLTDASGAPLGSAPAVLAIAKGEAPAGMSPAAAARYEEALAALAASGVAASDIAGLAVFETDEPARAFALAREDVLSRPLPELSEPFVRTELFDDFCVYEAKLPMPVYQEGAPPFSEEGGGWVIGAGGTPIPQGFESARIVVTLPRAPMPASGFPPLILSRTGAGGDRPLVDRGVHATAHGEAIAPGTGPALELARVGWAGVSVEGPHGGSRNVSGGDEQFLMFNVSNPTALRDNVRQSALELVVQAHLLADLTVPAADCPGLDLPAARFDAGRVALMGHSMGATIAPLSMSAEPGFRGLLLSGAGGSYIANVIFKESPLPVRGFAEVLLGIAGKWTLHEHDPLVSLLQWAVEPSDPPVYAGAIVEGSGPRHVLMMQGIVDTYILPPMANTLSLAMHLDLAGAPLDQENAELAQFAPLEGLLGYSGRARVELPVQGNESAGAATAVVVQHLEDGIEDGHEVVFQTEAPKRQYRCFLATLAADQVPTVTTGLDDASCPLPSGP